MGHLSEGKGKGRVGIIASSERVELAKSHFILNLSYGEGKENIQGGRATFQVFTSLPNLILSSHFKD